MLELKRGAAPEFRYDRLAVPVLKKKRSFHVVGPVYMQVGDAR